MEGRKQIVKVLLVLFFGYLCWVLGNNFWGMYQVRGRISEAKLELTEAKQENERLVEKMGEVGTDEFKEREVRNKLSRQLSGETVVIVQNSEFRTQNLEENKKRELANWEKWLSLFK